ncbi:hypothetical protein F7725_026835 [Dissostichus mawsoni]|uniref:Uncharacterized protein n=1 Tax=Dissostichus mawsoni TaxID=36200 RepID=A0A7J5X843_DISMA|nr:hypothetical protein F7725_026835 [Dissostichus mawsoni]
MESNADLVDGRLLTLEATCAELPASNAKLRAKTADLEPHSRLKNIRIIGLPESIEGGFLLKWIHSSPPTHNRWIHEILYCVRLERIRFSLSGSLTTFHNTWQPFLDHIDTLTIDEEPNT